MDLSIVIVNYNTKDHLEQCLKSVFEQTKSIEYEVFVVDNASADGSQQMVKDAFPQVKLIENEENAGFAKANNQAMKLSKREFVLLLNSDIKVKNNAIKEMLDFINSNEKIGLIGCRLLNADGSIQRSCWGISPSIKDALIENLYLFRLLKWSKFVKSRDICLKELTKPIKVSHILGACFMIRKEVIDQIGLLDESYFMFLEETDLCWRAMQQGWEICYYPEAEMIHYGQQAIKKNPGKIIPEKSKSYLRFLRKNTSYSESEILAVKLIFSIGAFLRSILWIKRFLFNREKQIARGMIESYVKDIIKVYSY